MGGVLQSNKSVPHYGFLSSNVPMKISLDLIISDPEKDALDRKIILNTNL